MTGALARCAPAAALLLAACASPSEPPALPSRPAALPPASEAAVAAEAPPPASAAPLASASAAPAAPEADAPPTRYPLGARHSPLTAGVVAGLRATLARGSGRPDVFAKVGDSITVSGHFARCLVGDDVRWGEHPQLAAARDFFARTPAVDGASSFARETQAARVGWRAVRALEGSQPPLDRELSAIRPGWAVVLLGTNDTFPDIMPSYRRTLLAVLDALLARGVVPLVSTLPPRRDSLQARQMTLEMNAVITSAAQSRQVPLMDLFGALDALPGAGLNRDGVHPDAYTNERYHPCWFDAAGLGGGMNQRNLLVLEALDRVRRKVLGDEAPDPEPPPLPGRGTWDDPLQIEAPAAVVSGDTRDGDRRAARYGCGRGDLAGPERVVRIEARSPGSLRARLFTDQGEAVLRWLPSPDPAACAARGRNRLDASIKPGTSWLVIDTPSPDRAGPFELVLIPR